MPLLTGSRQERLFTARAVALLDIVLDDVLELIGKVLAAQCHRLLAINEDGRCRCSPVPGSEMPMSECLLSPGPLTMQPMTAS